MVRGFLLDSDYRVEGAAATVRLWGVLEDGSSFCAEIPGVEAEFFIVAGQREQAARLGAAPEPGPLLSLDGAAVDRVRARTPSQAQRLRELLEGAGIETLEADLRFTSRFLIDRGIRGALAIEGAATPGPRVRHRFRAPALAPAELTPELRVLSLDIETDPLARSLFSFALHGSGVAEVHLIGGGPGTLPSFATEHDDEKALLAALEARIVAIDPDVLTGWNLIGFDLMVLERRARELGQSLRIGRDQEPLRLRIDRSFWGASRAEARGRAVLDGVDLLRGAFISVEDYRLETVARAILGEGKLIHADGEQRGGRAAEIERQFREDRSAFVEYNLKDAELVSRILDRTGLVRLAVRRSLLTGMALDRVGASIASFDSLYLPELRRRGHVAPNVGAGSRGEPGGATAGGAVLEPVTGIHDRVLAFDFKSLYPSLIRTFNIDPLTHCKNPAPGEDLIRTPAGECFRREPGILPAILARLMAVREAAKRANDATASQATKILMNSFYGVLASPSCRFHSARIANAITGTGQALLHATRERVEELGYRVLYGDTDSLFVASGATSDASALELGRKLATQLNADLARRLEREHGVESRLELELEALWLKLFFPHMRHGAGGARKRYAGVVEEDGHRRVVFVGMESVRRDWTAAAKEFQRGLYERLFAEASPDDLASYVQSFLGELRAGARDAQLVYKKALRKELAEYTATTPPHVKAARLGPTGARLIEYVMTREGPEPIAERRHPLDHEHYVQKQIRPIAEAILPALGLDWETLADPPRQLRLF